MYIKQKAGKDLQANLEKQKVIFLMGYPEGHGSDTFRNMKDKQKQNAFLAL
jgi:hypothetical protein